MKILIGIQARTNSTRLPNKVLRRISGITIIDNVINSCHKSSLYLNRFSAKTNVKAELCVVIPKDDPIKNHLKNRKEISVYEGDETDLISRYKVAMDATNADYLVRITSDCFLLPPFLITKTVNTAIKNNYNFVTNAHPKYRTFFDGADVEMCDKQTFYWLDEVAKEKRYREHVFSYICEKMPTSLSIGHIFNYLDLSALKLSIDTEKDLELVTKQYTSIEEKKLNWEVVHGKHTCHMF